MQRWEGGCQVIFVCQILFLNFNNGVYLHFQYHRHHVLKAGWVWRGSSKVWSKKEVLYDCWRERMLFLFLWQKKKKTILFPAAMRRICYKKSRVINAACFWKPWPTCSQFEAEKSMEANRKQPISLSPYCFVSSCQFHKKKKLLKVKFIIKTSQMLLDYATLLRPAPGWPPLCKPVMNKSPQFSTF